MESVRVRYVDGTGMESPLCLQPIRSGAEELLVNIPVLDGCAGAEDPLSNGESDALSTVDDNGTAACKVNCVH